MSVFGYIFYALEQEHRLSTEEQQTALADYANSLELEIDELVVEKEVNIKRPFRKRAEGGKLFERCGPGDTVIAMKAEWVLSSAVEGGKLLQQLRKKEVALHCVDLGENISVDEKRKLVVSEGCAAIVLKLLSSLAVCESSGHGDAIKVTKRNLKKEGKYTGGPVPFGWEVNNERCLVQHNEQQKIIKEMIAMREDRWSYRDISKKLKNEFDIKLSHAGIRRILEADKKKKKILATEEK